MKLGAGKVRGHLIYCLSLESNSQKEAWSNIMILLITRLLKMSDDRVSC